MPRKKKSEAVAVDQKTVDTVYNATRRGVSGVLELATMLNLGGQRVSGHIASSAVMDELCFYHLLGIPDDVRGRIPDNELAALHATLHDRLDQSLAVALKGIEAHRAAQRSSEDDADQEVWEDLTNVSIRGDA